MSRPDMTLIRFIRFPFAWRPVALILAVVFLFAPSFSAADAQSGAVREVQASIATLRGQILPALAVDLSALQAESAATIRSVGAGETIIGMRRDLVTMDEALAVIGRALNARTPDMRALLETIETFSADAVAFGIALETLVGKEPRFEPLRLEDAQARKRLLDLARDYQVFADAVSALLRRLPGAIDSHRRDS